MYKYLRSTLNKVTSNYHTQYKSQTQTETVGHANDFNECIHKHIRITVLPHRVDIAKVASCASKRGEERVSTYLKDFRIYTHT